MGVGAEAAGFGPDPSHPPRLAEPQSGWNTGLPAESSLAEALQGAPAGLRLEGQGLQGGRMSRGLPYLHPERRPGPGGRRGAGGS